MTEGPTIINGPLHTASATLGHRKIVAYFATQAQADAASQALVSAGLPSDRIAVTRAQEEAAALKPADDTILGKIREAVLPDDGQTGARAAVHEGHIMLTVTPDEAAVDQVVAVLEATKPSHFDADLERWRNSSPA